MKKVGNRVVDDGTGLALASDGRGHLLCLAATPDESDWAVYIEDANGAVTDLREEREENPDPNSREGYEPLTAYLAARAISLFRLHTMTSGFPRPDWGADIESTLMGHIPPIYRKGLVKPGTKEFWEQVVASSGGNKKTSWASSY